MITLITNLLLLKIKIKTQKILFVWKAFGPVGGKRKLFCISFQTIGRDTSVTLQCRPNKQKSLKVAKWRKDDWRMMKDEAWRMMISSCWGVLVYDRQTNGWTDEQTFVNVESLSRLKMIFNLPLSIAWKNYILRS